MSKSNLLLLSKLYQTFKSSAQQKLVEFSKQRNLVTRAFDAYEEFIGVKEVRKSQFNVLKAESEFIDASRQRRDLHAQLSQVQEQLKQVRQKLDSVHRGDEAYLELVTNEHKLIKSETNFSNQLRRQEEIEREFFSRFSQSLRDSQEVERMRQEKTKYLSLIGSIVGALLGIIATSINHAMRMKDFKQILVAIEAQQRRNSNQEMASSSSRTSEDMSESINHGAMDTLRNGSTVFAKTKEEIEVERQKRIELKQKNQKLEADISARNLELTELIHETQSSLEYRMKINALATVAVTYALIAVTVPLFIKFFGGE